MYIHAISGCIFIPKVCQIGLFDVDCMTSYSRVLSSNMMIMGNTRPGANKQGVSGGNTQGISDGNSDRNSNSGRKSNRGTADNGAAGCDGTSPHHAKELDAKNGERVGRETAEGNGASDGSIDIPRSLTGVLNDVKSSMAGGFGSTGFGSALGNQIGNHLGTASSWIYSWHTPTDENGNKEKGMSQANLYQISWMSLDV
jgi:hypothetical protein